MASLVGHTLVKALAYMLKKTLGDKQVFYYSASGSVIIRRKKQNRKIIAMKNY